jgi:hypothetical protein
MRRSISGFSINAPQLDVLQSFVGGMQFSPQMSMIDNLSAGIGQTIRDNTTGLLSPLPKLTIEAFQGSTFSPNGSREITDWGDHLVDQTGLGYISRITGHNFFNNQGLFGSRTDLQGMEPGEQDTRSGTTLSNAITGLKHVPDWTKWQDVAVRERQELLQKWFTDYSRNILGNPQNVPPPQVAPGK